MGLLLSGCGDSDLGPNDVLGIESDSFFDVLGETKGL